jgi:hypothetical protein
LVSAISAALLITACGEDKTPKPKTDATIDSHPVKNVESLPSGTIQEGAKTMNRSADMGGSLEQQKQERDKDIEAQGK